MRADKRKKLQAKGWEVGSVNEFLELSPEAAAYIELKLSLSNTLRDCRTKGKLTQAEVAKLLNTSQSRVAKMEAGDPSVSIDLLIKSLFALGVSSKDLARAIR